MIGVPRRPLDNSFRRLEVFVAHSMQERLGSARKPARVLGVVLGLVGATMATEVSQAAEGQGQAETRRAASWTSWLDDDLSRTELGLTAGSSARHLSRAAIQQHARRLGLRHAGRTLHLVRALRVPGRNGARALRQLRFQQTVGPERLRVLWSQIDVTVSAGVVRSIAATVVPIKSARSAGAGGVSGAEALAIARRASPGPEQALRPLPVAYAGAPSSDRSAPGRTARRAWVVEIKRSETNTEEFPADVCIVIDASTGEVVGRWPGMADRPDQGPNSRGTFSAGTSPRAQSARARAAATTSPSLLDIFDASGGAEPYHYLWKDYAEFRVSGDPRVSRNWPAWNEGFLPGAKRTTTMDALTANARNVARTICDVRGYCGKKGWIGPHAHGTFTGYVAWDVLGNDPQAANTRADRLHQYVTVVDRHIMAGDGDPNRPSSDIIAHEFGHIIDAEYAGDRALTQNLEGDAVEEGLADMFAYDYDWGDATLGEESPRGVQVDWANPGNQDVDDQPYPAHMRDYDSTPPMASDGKPDEHFNSTILSHAYYLFVGRVGRDKAGRILHAVPGRLSPRPTFSEVRRSFVQSASALYGPTTATHASTAFANVGLLPPPPHEPSCGPNPC
jgi:Zn-dependent metalloprotease